MKENTKKGVSRREFLGLSALGLASLTILPSWAMNGVRIAPSDRVVLGFIGLGQQALSDFKGFAAYPYAPANPRKTHIDHNVGSFPLKLAIQRHVF